MFRDFARYVSQASLSETALLAGFELWGIYVIEGIFELWLSR